MWIYLVIDLHVQCTHVCTRSQIKRQTPPLAYLLIDGTHALFQFQKIDSYPLLRKIQTTNNAALSVDVDDKNDRPGDDGTLRSV